MCDRAYGLVRMASIGWPASYPDINILQNCNLFRDQAKRDEFFRTYGPNLAIIADQGFFSQLFPGIMCPIASVHSRGGIPRFLELTDEERMWSSKISAAEVKIENLFSQIFAVKYNLLKRRPHGLCNDPLLKLPMLIKAAAILYNAEIIMSGRSILDGPRIFDSLI